MPTSTTREPSPASSSFLVSHLRRRLYLHRFFNEIGDGLIKVFVPILIYQRTQSIAACLVWLAGYYVLQSALNLTLARALVARPPLWLWLRMLPLVLTQLLLISGRTDLWLVLGLTLSTALANVFYWVPLNFLMSASVAGGKAGTTVGIIRASSVVGKIVAPILSGLLVAGHGIEVSVILALIAYTCSLVPLIALRVPRLAQEHSPQPEPVPSADPPLSTFLGAYAVAGVWDTAEVFWALHVYILSATVVDAGVAAGLLQLGVVLANLVTGRLTDQRRWRSAALAALALYCLFWALRPFALAPWAIFALSIAAGFVRPGFEIPVFSGYLTTARRTPDIDRWLVLREVAIKSGGLFLVGGVALLGAPGMTPFVAAAAGGLLFIFPLNRLAEQK